MVGPLVYEMEKKSGPVYLLLLFTGKVHSEMVCSIMTETDIIALQLFIATQCGMPKVVYSDHRINIKSVQSTFAVLG